MKRFYLSEWIKTNTQLVTLILLLLTSSVSIYLSGSSSLSSPVQIGVSVVGFVQEIFDGIFRGINGFVNSIGELSALREKYQQLLEKNRDYQGIERILADLRAENQRLKEQLQFKESVNSQFVSARVIAKDPTNITHNFMINRGHLHGVRKNDAIIAFQGNDYGLVGRVIEVGFTTSQVQSIINPANYVASRFQKSRFEGLVSGRGNDRETLRMQFVRKQALDEVQPGDLVITSGLNSLYPRDLPIGRVVQVYNKAYETTIELDLKPVVDFSKLEYVFWIQSEEASTAP